MFLDKEIDVICLLQTELKHSEPLLYKSNSFCKKVSRYIKSINSFSDNSGHEALPPDYYSDELNCMLDVMRVNDTEIRKTYNPLTPPTISIVGGGNAVSLSRPMTMRSTKR